MFRSVCFLLLICLLANACDKVKDTPVPNTFSSFELKTVNVNLVLNGKSDIDIAAANQFPGEVSIRIKTQPGKGTITLDEARKIFVYEPIEDSTGKDSAEYEACSQSICKTGWIYIIIDDTTRIDTDSIVIPVCPIVISNYSFLINTAGFQSLTLPDTFNCGAKITALIANPFPLNIVLEAGKIKVNFSKPFVDTLIFSFKVCTNDNRCDTGQITLFVNLPADPINPCIALFKPKNDSFIMNRNIITKSFNYNLILPNDSACIGDIKPESLSIVSGPNRGTAILKSNIQGRFLRYDLDSGNQNIAGLDSLTYRINGISGATGTAKIFFRIL